MIGRASSSVFPTKKDGLQTKSKTEITNATRRKGHTHMLNSGMLLFR